MTTDHDFKLLVRARMTETGENYTAAHAEVIAEREEAGPVTAAEFPPDAARRFKRARRTAARPDD